MKKEISKNDINKMNKIIFEKINDQFDKDLTPSEFIATSRLALAFLFYGFVIGDTYFKL